MEARSYDAQQHQSIHGEDLRFIEDTLAGETTSCRRRKADDRPAQQNKKRRLPAVRQRDAASREGAMSAPWTGNSELSSCTQSVPAPREPVELNAARYNQPGPRSNRRAWHCEACDVWVSRSGISPQPTDWVDWAVHTSGQLHKRQLLSIRETGAPGQLLVSAFEDISGDRVRQFQKCSGVASALGSLSLDAGIRQLQKAALKELLHFSGASSPDHRRLSERFSLVRLEDAWSLLTQQRWPRRFFRQLTINARNDGRLKLGMDAAMLAAASRAMQLKRFPYTELELDVLCILERFADAPSAMAGLSLLARALRHSDIVELTLSFGSMPEDTSTRMIEAFLKSLATSFETCLPLRRLSVRPQHSYCFMQSASEIRAAIKQSTSRIRAAVVETLQPRLPLRTGQLMPELPTDVVLRILDLVAPHDRLTVQFVGENCAVQ